MIQDFGDKFGLDAAVYESQKMSLWLKGERIERRIGSARPAGVRADPVQTRGAGNRRIGSVRPVAAHRDSEGFGGSGVGGESAAHATASPKLQVELYDEGRPLQASENAHEKSGQQSLGRFAEKQALKEESLAEGN